MSELKLNKQFKIIKSQRKGSVLLVTLILLLILFLIGSYVVVDSMTEANVSTNTNDGWNSFYNADMVNKYAVGVLVQAVSPQGFDNIKTNFYEDESLKMTYQKSSSAPSTSIAERYLKIVGSDDSLADIIVRSKDNNILIAKSVVESGNVERFGSAEGGKGYGDGNASRGIMGFTVSTAGRSRNVFAGANQYVNTTVPSGNAGQVKEVSYSVITCMFLVAF